jgi:hypothetical protein
MPWPSGRWAVIPGDAADEQPANGSERHLCNQAETRFDNKITGRRTGPITPYRGKKNCISAKTVPKTPNTLRAGGVAAEAESALLERCR